MPFHTLKRSKLQFSRRSPSEVNRFAKSLGDRLGKCLPLNCAEAMIISSKFMAQKDDFNQSHGGQKSGVLEISEDCSRWIPWSVLAARCVVKV